MIPGIEGPKTSNLPLGTCNRTNHPSKSSNTITVSANGQLRQTLEKKWNLQKLDSSIDCPKQWECGAYASFSASTFLKPPFLEDVFSFPCQPWRVLLHWHHRPQKWRCPHACWETTEDVRVGHQFSCYHVKWCEVLIGHIGQKMVPMCICTHPTSFEAFTIFWWGGKIMKMKPCTSWDDGSDGLWQCYWQCYAAMHIWQEKLAWFDMIWLWLASLNSKTEAWNTRFLPPEN